MLTIDKIKQSLAQEYHCPFHDLNPEFQAPLAWAIINWKIDSSIIRKIIATVWQEHYNEFISEFYDEDLVEKLAKKYFSIWLNNFSLWEIFYKKSCKTKKDYIIRNIYH